jgi:hypothetical protein
MTISLTAYYKLASRQPTDWLRRSAATPGPYIRPIHRAAQALVVRHREGSAAK